MELLEYVKQLPGKSATVFLDNNVIRISSKDLELTFTATIGNYLIKLKVHQTTYSDYELGNLNIPLRVLHLLADFYNTSIDYLLFRTNVAAPYPKK